MRMTDLIERKKAGYTLTEEEIRWMISGYTAGDIPDYQMSAMAMAICWRGMDDRETTLLTQAMMDSGDTVDLTAFGPKTVDKHSTGGVGDKTTLIVGPVVASLGGKLAKMSGRGLGHTGGTVDKLESIPGYRTELSGEEFLNVVQQVGMAVVGQSGNLCPADKKLYALRDVTGTVDSMPLIASSVMSKKLAAGARSIVLDVKVGSGAFMTTLEDARTLAEKMVGIGRASGRNMAALLTNMDRPLGRAIGNALEVQEAARLLQGEGEDDLREVCVALASTMLSLCNGWSRDQAEEQVEESLRSGAAFDTMCRWVHAQGGDERVLKDPSLLPRASCIVPVQAKEDAYLVRMDAKRIGEVSVLLGAGRTRKEDPIDSAAGIVLERKPGDRVRPGDTLAWLHTDNPDCLDDAAREFEQALCLGPEKPSPDILIYGEVR